MKIAAGMALGAALVLVSIQAAAQQTRVIGPSASAGSSGSKPPVYYGPTELPPRYVAPPPSVGEAPGYITYMNTKCSGLHDALRTAPARGLASATVAEMRKNYQLECAENESEARSQYSRESGEKRQVALSERDAAKRAQERTKQQEEQCGESKRILITKKARTDLSDGERSDLQRFEASYRARCS